MVRIKIEKRVCDLCGNDGYLEDCMLCGREFCLLCQKRSYFGNYLCKECANRADYKEILEKYEVKYSRLAELENNELSKLPKFKPKICEKCGGAFRKLITFRFRNEIHKTCDQCRKEMKGEVHVPA